MNKALHEAALAAKELREEAAMGRVEAGVGIVARILEVMLEELGEMRERIKSLEQGEFDDYDM